MIKKVIVAGLLGALVLMMWTFLVNGIFRFKVNMDMKQIPNERQVYEILKENIVEPGRYACNPELTPERRFPEGEPVFSVLYGGVGHEAAGSHMLFGLIIFLLSPMIATWLLSQTTEKILSSYSRKVLFFTGIGLLYALYGDLTSFGIGDYPLSDAIIIALHNIIVWIVIGLVVAWRLKPEESVVKHS
jgi:hypothetical protein